MPKVLKIVDMKWIHCYQLFLFDFDGVLVNTEELHYKAYLKMCSDRGFSLKWDQRTYMNYALYSATGVKEGIYAALPKLQLQEPNWDILYNEKKKAYVELLHSQGPSLMPGIELLLDQLQAHNIKRCVVTHSPLDQIELIRKQHPILRSIPNWITREQYIEPKPSSECYQKALKLFRNEGDRVIGFEDSPRGLKALLGTDAEGVLVSEFLDKSEIECLLKEVERPFSYYQTFLEMS